MLVVCLVTTACLLPILIRHEPDLNPLAEQVAYLIGSTHGSRVVDIGVGAVVELRGDGTVVVYYAGREGRGVVEDPRIPIPSTDTGPVIRIMGNSTHVWLSAGLETTRGGGIEVAPKPVHYLTYPSIEYREKILDYKRDVEGEWTIYDDFSYSGEPDPSKWSSSGSVEVSGGWLKVKSYGGVSSKAVLDEWEVRVRWYYASITYIWLYSEWKDRVEMVRVYDRGWKLAIKVIVDDTLVDELKVPCHSSDTIYDVVVRSEENGTTIQAIPVFGGSEGSLRVGVHFPVQHFSLYHSRRGRYQTFMDYVKTVAKYFLFEDMPSNSRVELYAGGSKVAESSGSGDIKVDYPPAVDEIRHYYKDMLKSIMSGDLAPAVHGFEYTGARGVGDIDLTPDGAYTEVELSQGYEIDFTRRPSKVVVGDHTITSFIKEDEWWRVELLEYPFSGGRVRAYFPVELKTATGTRSNGTLYYRLNVVRGILAVIIPTEYDFIELRLPGGRVIRNPVEVYPYGAKREVYEFDVDRSGWATLVLSP